MLFAQHELKNLIEQIKKIIDLPGESDSLRKGEKKQRRVTMKKEVVKKEIESKYVLEHAKKIIERIESAEEIFKKIFEIEAELVDFESGRISVRLEKNLFDNLLLAVIQVEEINTTKFSEWKFYPCYDDGRFILFFEKYLGDYRATVTVYLE
jgi:hypothetical protein